ncbi:MAG: hypothetical protein AAFW95_11320 [Cyanobacteria bacterium J06638_6]
MALTAVQLSNAAMPLANLSGIMPQWSKVHQYVGLRSQRWAAGSPAQNSYGECVNAKDRSV